MKVSKKKVIAVHVDWLSKLLNINDSRHKRMHIYIYIIAFHLRFQMTFIFYSVYLAMRPSIHAHVHVI